MKPDAYMPYYGSDFETGTKGLKREVKWSYLAAIWHYWSKGCAGLPDDDEQLCEVCDCQLSDWARTKPFLFGKDGFWTLIDGRWHQNRTLEIYRESEKTYNKQVENARLARLSKLGANPEANLNINPEAKVDLKMQSESESESESEAESLINKQGVAPPTLQQVKTKAEFIGMPAEDAEAFWNHFESTGWIDKNGNLIVKWENKLATWKTSNQAKRYQDRQEGKAGISAAQSVLYSKEYDRVCDKLRKLEDGAASDAMGSKYYSASDKAMIQKLRARKAELRKILNIVI